MKRLSALALTLLLVLSPAAAAVKPYRIDVTDQSRFDGMETSVREAVRLGKRSIIVDIAPGVYFFKDGHLVLEGMDWPQVELTIRGSEGTVLVGKGKEGIFDGRGFSTETCYLDSDMQPVRLCTDMRRATRLIIVKDKEKGLCVLDTGDRKLTVSDCRNVYIQIPQWYLSRVYPVRSIRRGKILFEAADLSIIGLQYNVNADFNYDMQLPRYRLFNLPEMRGRWLHACEAARFLMVSGCRFKSLALEGLTFRGNSAGERLVHFHFCSAGSYAVRNCRFEGIMREAVYSSGTADVTVADCFATGCARRVFVTDEFSSRASVLNNRLSGNGVALMNDVNILCRGDGFRIEGNTVSDFGYGAIGVGMHYTENPETFRVAGVVCGNEIYLTAEAFEKAPMEGLMDSGAIYTSTYHDDVTIRDNYIHDINGPCDNRGIFCDDGAIHLKILRNKVLRVANSYTIDLRRVASVERDPKSRVSRTNVGNELDGNTVDGPVRFECRGGVDGCRIGKNTVLSRKEAAAVPAH